MSYWQGKTALVTGGSDGLGLAIATALGSAGANVAIAARGEERLAAAQLVSKGAAALAIRADVTVPADAENMIRATVERFGSLTALFNCAGRSARGDLAATSDEDFRELLELNFVALARCTRLALPHLLAARGHVVNIGSLASKSAARYLGAYPASKFAVAAYSQQLRLELGEQGLHVLLVCPGPIARDEARHYAGTENLPDSASRPGGGVKVGRHSAAALAHRILLACERRRAELIVPGRARLLFALAQLSPRLGDWLVRRMT